MQRRWPDRLVLAAAGGRGGRRIRRLRRWVAIGLLVISGALAVRREQPPDPGVVVFGLTRDLAAGATVSAGDLTTIRTTLPPDGAIADSSAVAGRLLTGPARRGEILTDVRLVPAQGPSPGPGRVAVPIRPADPGAVGLLSPGVHVAVLAVGENGAATMLSKDAVVLALPPPVDRTANAKRLVVLAVPVEVADRLAAATVAGNLALRFT